MAIVINELEVDATDRGEDRPRRDAPPRSGRRRLDPDELASALKKQVERRQRLWAD